MNLYFRLMILFVRCFFRFKQIRPTEEVCTSFRVWPNDLDLNLHMNNGRYLTIMDLARFDLMGHLGVLRLAFRRQWFPIIGGTQVIFGRSLSPFQKYKVYTRLEYWDDKWFVIAQRFEANGKTCAYGRIRGLMKGRGKIGVISPFEVLGQAGQPTESPELSEGTKKWLDTLSLRG